ncbi:MAG TPA: exopolysaccharide biosynthesis polyprenyl glycosylphosphotransferase [Beijerinckiaceae bacterium]|nr:exopolysaccharide biosynthesis polyprenyl glycosylphosphotransferase [Beijerinckiaceae bacterium]
MSLDFGSAAAHTPFAANAKLLARLSFSLVAVLVDVAAIMAAAFAADVGYNFLMHGNFAVCAANIQLGMFAAILFAIANMARQGYKVSAFMDVPEQAQKAFSLWTMSFLAAATFGFLAKAIEDSSRGAFLAMFFIGISCLFAARAALTLFVRRHATNDGILAARIMIVGFREDVAAFMSQHNLPRQGMTVLGTKVLSDSSAMTDVELSEVTGVARRLVPDDIFLAVPWDRADMIERCTNAFLRVPSSLHLVMDPHSALSRFAVTQMTTRGSISSLRLRGYAMSSVGMALKRLFDVLVSLLALIVLLPLFLVVAIAIKLESRGPVLFFQTRHGFNKMPFRIMKFRSMRTMEDGQNVRQVTANDPRITRVGRLLRKYNIDELPQLFNVLRGEMSLVGPRPHALVHDQQFEPEVVLYARRHNVKPGITGWAQVSGYRGETDTSEKISKRVQYDLYYIDHWSFVFDVWILFLTIFSRRAYANAA